MNLEVVAPSGVIRSHLTLTGLHNTYNVTAAVAAALHLGIPAETIGPALGHTHAAFGRGERIRLADRELLLMLTKNPVGANENIHVASHEPDELHVIALLNDRTADGQDVSWIWDVDYELLFGKVTSLTLSGDRAHD